jgi:ABC-type transport system substrate-binding protein
MSTLRLVGSPFGVTSLDPALARDLDAIFLMRQLHRGLLALTTTLDTVPALAEFESSDGQVYSFRIRDDARFADGKLIRAEDVHHSLVRSLSLGNIAYLGDIVGAGSILAGATQSLAGFEATDDRRFSIRLAAPNVTFPARMSAVQAAIVDASNFENGSGPFVVAHIDDEVLELVPNPSFPNAPSHTVSFRIGQAAINAPNLMQTGDIDIAIVDGDMAALLDDPASHLDIQIERTPMLATYYIALSNTMPPWDNVNDRRAIRDAFAPTQAVRRLYGDTVDPATGLVPPVLLDPMPSSRKEGISPPSGSIAMPVYAADIEPVVQLAAAAETAGVQVQPIQVPWDAFLSGLAEHRFPAYAMYWGADYPSPDAFLRMLFHSHGPENYVEFVDEEYDRLVDAGNFAEAQQRLLDLAVVIPVYHDVQYTAVRRGILGTPVSPMGLLGLESVEMSS